MNFQPDFRHMVDAVKNKRPRRLPLYEHKIRPGIMEKIRNRSFTALQEGDESDRKEFFTNYCEVFKKMTYDTVSFEVEILEFFPGHGAIYGNKPGPIQDRTDFKNYPWDQTLEKIWEVSDKQFGTLSKCLPEGMKIVGGFGYTLLETSEDLVGYEKLCYLLMDDPELFADIYRRIGDFVVALWDRLLKKYVDSFAVCRFCDDLGFKSGTLLSPPTIIEHIVPQYRRIIDLIHKTEQPVLWHSCGRIFDVMEPMIEAGIDAKHSNEDTIAPFDEWIDRYSDKIGLMGGFDTDFLCRKTPDEIYAYVLEKGQEYRSRAKGYALGSGSQIVSYMPVENYLAMIRATQEIRKIESEKA